MIPDCIVLHYSATFPSQDIGVDEIRRWHVEDRGYQDIGYHFVVRLDGTIEHGRPVWKQGAHCKGHNHHSIGICYVGGLMLDGKTGYDSRTVTQKISLNTLIDSLRTVYGELPVYGHREMSGQATQCPGFDASAEYNDGEMAA